MVRFLLFMISVMHQSRVFRETESGQASRLEIQVGVDVSVLPEIYRTGPQSADRQDPTLHF